MRTPPPIALLAPWALCACGDSLVGGAALDELLGLEPGSGEVAWELRWLQGPEEGLLVGCELADPWSGPQGVEDVVMGTTVVRPPELDDLGSPPAMMEGDGYRWGLALLVLTERLPWLAAGPDRNELSEGRGTWGLASGYALLVAEGDLQRLSEELLMMGPEEAERLAEGAQIVGLMPEIPMWMESFQGALYPVSVDEQIDLEEGGLPVTQLDALDPMILEVFGGGPMGGATRQDCTGEDPEEGAR
ncbi:MAG: hypothetical protein ABIO70_09640 [Pseudomonadota bacterium]